MAPRLDDLPGVMREYRQGPGHPCAFCGREIAAASRSMSVRGMRVHQSCAAGRARRDGATR